MFNWIGSHKLSFFSGLFVLLVAAVGLFAYTKQVSPVSLGWFGPVYSNSGVALSGYDPVEYHIHAVATPGNSSLSYQWKNSNWRFISNENMEMFKSSPETYAPKFGGFCSFAVSKGFTAAANPLAWFVQDGKLYMFADEGVKDNWVSQISDGVIEVTKNQWAKRPDNAR